MSFFVEYWSSLKGGQVDRSLQNVNVSAQRGEEIKKIVHDNFKMIHFWTFLKIKNNRYNKDPFYRSLE
jgi:glutathione peroxidase-family protein